MIYLDVTGSCKSAKSTGIQRATRSIFRELGRRETILPMSWFTAQLPKMDMQITIGTRTLARMMVMRARNFAVNESKGS